METTGVVTDFSCPGRAEVRLENAIAKAEWEAKAAIQATAASYSGVHEALQEARDFPELFVPDAFTHKADAVEFAVRSAVLDLSMRLNLSETAVRAYDHTVATLRARARRVWMLFREGEISVANVRVVTDTIAALPDHLWSAFDSEAAAAASLTPPRFKSRMRAVREKLAADAIERHERAVEDRRTWLEPDRDGMSNWGVYAPAVDLARANANVDRIAREMLELDDETRTLAQLRADVALDLLVGNLDAGTGRGTITTGVIVPVGTLLGTSDEGAILDGYGPIDAKTARELAGSSKTLYRILTDPVSGDIRNVESPNYRPDARMIRNVRHRDRVCVTPGCGRPAEDCDIDHTIPWPNGPTRYDNLKPLCRAHHRVKHNSKWNTEQDANGATTWTSPTGFVRAADPPPF